MAKKEKNVGVLKAMLKKPGFYYGVACGVAMLFFTRQVLNANGVGLFIPVVAIELIIGGLVVWTLSVMRKKGAPLEKQFLFVALILGVLFIVILPPGQSPDEVTHFKRAYGISEGIFLPEEIEGTGGRAGSEIPIGTDFLSRDPGHGTYSEIVDRIDDSTEERSLQTYTSAALYSFICYIPQIFGALVGGLFGFSVLGMAYLMEVFNYIVWVFLIYNAIKFIPKFKSVILFIALLPITIQEATSLSPDALTIGLSIFLVSYVLYLAYGEKTLMSKKDYVILSLSAIVIGFCKIVYLPLILLMLIIPKERFGTKKRRWIFLVTLFGLVGIINLAWLWVSSKYLMEYRTGVNSKEQLIGILKNPLKYLMIMFRTVNISGQGWMANLLGTTLGAFTFRLPYVLFLVSFAIATLFFAQRDESLKLKKFDRWIFVAVFLIIVVLIFTSLYMQWTPYGDEVVDGIQGRYFLPILMLVPLMICRTDLRKKYPAIISESTILYYSLFINMVACVTIFAQNV